MAGGCDQALCFSESSALGAKARYRQRDPEATVLFRVVRDHLEDFLELARQRSPEFEFAHPAVVCGGGQTTIARDARTGACPPTRIQLEGRYGGMNEDEAVRAGAWPSGPHTSWTA